MYLHVKMVKADDNQLLEKTVKIEVVVYVNIEVTKLRMQGYKIVNMEVKDGEE